MPATATVILRRKFVPGYIPVTVSTLVNANTFPGVEVAKVVTQNLGVATFANENVFDAGGVIEFVTPIDVVIDELVNANAFPDGGTVTRGLLVSVPTLVNANAFPAGATVEVLSGALPSARAWRVSITEVATSGNPTDIGEIEFRGTVGGADQTSGGTAISSGGATANGNAFNDNTSDGWVSSGSVSVGSPVWIGYEWPVDPVQVAQVSITLTPGISAARLPRAGSIDYRNSAGVWVPVWYFYEAAWAAGQTRTYDLTTPLNAPVRTTQLVLEVVYKSTAAPVRVTQIVAEVARSI